MKRTELNHYIISKWDPADNSGAITRFIRKYEFVITETEHEIAIHHIKIRAHFLDLWFDSVFYLLKYDKFIEDPGEVVDVDGHYDIGIFLTYYIKTVIPSRFCLCDQEYLNIVLRDKGIQAGYIIHQLNA